MSRQRVAGLQPGGTRSVGSRGEIATGIALGTQWNVPLQRDWKPLPQKGAAVFPAKGCRATGLSLQSGGDTHARSNFST
jgi:hypothetical protein